MGRTLRGLIRAIRLEDAGHKTHVTRWEQALRVAQRPGPVVPWLGRARPVDANGRAVWEPEDDDWYLTSG